jgi:hypothetical protein
VEKSEKQKRKTMKGTPNEQEETEANKDNRRKAEETHFCQTTASSEIR